ncbi:helix-turn-helix transcriptional regulator [Nocardia australiensis]|uniref:helix-turn-helix transcriptional regulator n=1 Tax=Nocardia australiensis TaxID=2887191 RepID=UPI001D13E062|nr:AraC family transcriptional regulator [Nocardia australiensis]
MKDNTVIAESATTREVAPRERADYWSELINSYQRQLGYAFARPADFYGRTTVRRTSNYQIVRWHSEAVTYYRTPGQVRGDSDDDYRLLLPVSGHMALWQRDQHAVLLPGVGCLVTLDQPSAFAVADGTVGLFMTIPRREVDHRLDRAGRPGWPMDLSAGLGRVAVDLAAGLFAEGGNLSTHQFDVVSDRLVELLCMHVVGDLPTESGHLADVEAAVRRYVRAHVEDPDLSGAVVAHASGWSLRQVQLALRSTGTTPSRLIKEERLQVAYARLRSPAYSGWSITEIALRLGFGSVSAFSTAVRQRFGASPRDIRHG